MAEKKINLTDEIFKRLKIADSKNIYFDASIMFYLDQDLKQILGTNELSDDDCELINTGDKMVLTSIYTENPLTISVKEDKEHNKFVVGQIEDKEVMNIAVFNNNNVVNNVTVHEANEEYKATYSAKLQGNKFGENFNYRLQKDDEVIYDASLLRMGIQRNDHEKYDFQRNVPNENVSKSFLARINNFALNGGVKIPTDVEPIEYISNIYSYIFEDMQKVKGINRNI